MESQCFIEIHNKLVDLLGFNEQESSNALDYTVRICSCKFGEYKA